MGGSREHNLGKCKEYACAFHTHTEERGGRKEEDEEMAEWGYKKECTLTHYR